MKNAAIRAIAPWGTTYVRSVRQDRTDFQISTSGRHARFFTPETAREIAVDLAERSVTAMTFEVVPAASVGVRA